MNLCFSNGYLLDPKVEAGFLLDPLSITMALFVLVSEHSFTCTQLAAWRREVLKVLFVSEPVPVLDAHAGLRQQLGGHVSGLGRRWCVFLFPYLFLASTRIRSDRW